MRISPKYNNSEYQIYLNLFSQDINAINSDKATPFLYSNKDEYSVIFVDDLASFIFSETERRIIDFFSTTGRESLELYKKKRGECFEDIVNRLVKEVYNKDSFSNMKYIDCEKKRREIDIIIIQPEYIIDIECKSSYFNLYDCKTKSEIQMRVRGAFGKSLKSINAFYNVLQYGLPVKLTNSHNNNVIISEKTQLYPVQVTLYPIDIIGTHLHNIEKIDIGNFDIFPVNINFMDFYMIMFLASLNRYPFEQYLSRRYETINNVPNLQLDVDELDVFGFLTDPQNDRLYNILIQNHNDGVQQVFSINNDAYRREFNSLLTNYGMMHILVNYIPNEIRDLVDNIFKYEVLLNDDNFEKK